MKTKTVSINEDRFVCDFSSIGERKVVFSQCLPTSEFFVLLQKHLPLMFHFII